MPYYQNTDVQMFDAAVNRVIQQYQQQGLLPPQQATYLIGLWQQERASVINDFKMRFPNGNYNQANIDSVAAGYVSSKVRNTNPYMMPQTMMPYQQPMYVPYAQPQGQYGTPQSQIIDVNSNNNIATIQPTASVNQTRPAAPAPSEPTPVTEVSDAKFTKPVEDEPDTLYGKDIIVTEVGQIQVTSYRVGDGSIVKYVRITLKDGCRDANDALVRSKWLYNQKQTYFMDVTYTRRYKIPIPYDKFAEFIDAARKYINSEPEKYLHGINRLLDSYPRGISTAIEQFLVNSFNYEAEYGCIDPIHQCPLSVQQFSDIVELSNYDSPEKVVQRWYKNPKFKTRFATVCQHAIKNRINELVLYDPTKSVEDLKTILKETTGLTETEDLKLIDVVTALRPDLAKFAAASRESKLNDFGLAGKAIMNNTIIGVPNQRVTLTNIPNACLYRVAKRVPVITLHQMVCGGLDAEKKPTPSTSLFEYFLRTFAMAEDYCIDLIMEYNHAQIKYKATNTITEQIKLVPN